MSAMLRPRRTVNVRPVQWPLSEADIPAWKEFDSRFLSFDPNVSRFSQMQYITPTGRLEFILGHPDLFVRATDLITFLEKCPPEGLKDNYQIIVDVMFGTRERDTTWDLRTMRRTDYMKEARAIERLLGPDGPLISLGLRLMNDHNFTLAFPLDALPVTWRNKMASEKDLPPFFLNKVVNARDFHGNYSKHLMFNPFEYFMFSFGLLNLIGLHINGAIDYLSGWAVFQETIYTTLLEEYLSFYFPCNGAGVPEHHFAPISSSSTTESVFVSNAYSRKTQSFHPKPSNINSTPQSSPTTFDFGEFKLLKPSVLQQMQNPTSAVTRENLFLSTHPSAYKEVWRSETLLYTLMELWMAGYQIPEVVTSMSRNNPFAFGGLPSVDVVKSIRMVVRHMHFFINCVNNHSCHPMEDIRRNTFPVFQRRLYILLRYLFHHWPLDNSFRIVYETWLSYIQPWRYVDFRKSKTQPIRDSADVAVDRRWISFITENILFYSKLFSEMLLRLERVDLSATKNALMLYRLVKVFTAQETLRVFLTEIEAGLREPHVPLPQNTLVGTNRVMMSTPTQNRGSLSANASSYFGGGNLSPITTPHATTIWGGMHPGAPPVEPQSTSTNRFSYVKQLLKEFEGAAYVYEPIFSEENTNKALAVITLAASAKQSVLDQARSVEDQNGGQWTILSFFWSSFEMLSSSKSSKQGAVSLADYQKAAFQLEYSRSQLASFFDLLLQDNKSGPAAPFKKEDQDQSTPNATLAPTGPLQRCTLSYGNPDSDLPHSDEVALLIDYANSTSRAINNIFGKYIERHYFGDSILSRYLRALVVQPEEYLTIQKRHGYPLMHKPQRVVKYLPPRVSLRFMASYRFLTYFFTFLVLWLLFGWNTSSALFVFALMFFMYLSIVAIREPTTTRSTLLDMHMYHKNYPNPSFNTSVRDQISSPARRRNSNHDDLTS